MEPNRIDWSQVLVALLLIFVGGLFALTSIYGEFLWFEAIGYDGVFLTILSYRLGVFLGVTLLSFVALYASFFVAMRNVREVEAETTEGWYVSGIGLVAVIFGIRFSGAWDMVLRFLNSAPFAATDPIFGQRVGFYIYTLPVLNTFLDLLMGITIMGLVVSLFVYARHFGFAEPEDSEVDAPEFDVTRFLSNLRQYGYGQVSATVGVFVILLGIGYFLDRYGLLFSTRGAVFGMGATDQAIFQPLYLLLTITGIIGGIVMIANASFEDDRAVYVPIAILVGFLIMGTVGGAAYQSFVVEPDEFNKEARFIENEIQFTNHGFALDRIQQQDFVVSANLTKEQINANPGTIKNVRLWDARPMLTTYNELQIFRTYYTFKDIDVDRYRIRGNETQVMISARELDFEALPENSQSWVNRHLVYTHGYGVVMSPVGETTSEGLPELYIKNIPPESTAGPTVEQPRIYYGEQTDTYAIVNSNTRELDYPKGGQNVYNRYDGSGGVLLSSVTREVVYSTRFLAPSIFLSDSVTPKSRIQFHRNITDRVKTIAPFLKLDQDPYIVVANGKLYWIYDAYTTANRYPYSKRVNFKGEQVNYVRNSVKVVVDAYSGETTFYVANQNDPLIQTYRNAFPQLFQDLETMPDALQRHIRYPRDAFQIQAQMYLTYHMEDPKVFYNKEDVWRVPNEVTRGNQVRMEPYYIIMQFPEAEEPEFVMIQPYVPAGKENMIGWLAARSDPPNYGSLRAYHFSKQKLIYGPMQIESRIAQDTEISQRITLWSQAGSAVIRGNLLAIPINDTILYVEPLFLESQEAGALPELKRVIVAQGDQLTMQPTLEQALAARFGTVSPAPPTGQLPGLTPTQLERLQTLYDESQQALRRGDFQTYAQKISEIGDILESVERQREAANSTVEGEPPSTNSSAVG
ncbi:MAG: UPF0182 family protein [Halodesulfurarchaeum sp.]